jgi:RNA polymerase sigma factor (sigma-70 family)
MSTDVRLVQLHLEQRARLERMVLYRLRDPDLAADLVSEAFLRLHRRLRDGVAPTDAVAWLTRVTINLALSEGRHRAVVQRTADRLPRPMADVGPEEVALGRERAAQLAVALDRLPRFDRQLLLAAADGATGSELAAASGRTEGCVRTRLHRARRRLRDELAVPA